VGSEAPHRFWTQLTVRKAVSPLLSSVAQVGNLLYPPTGNRQNVEFSEHGRIDNPRYGRLPVCATGVAAIATSGLSAVEKI